MKKNIYVWSNCQGESIMYMLKKYHGDVYNVEVFENYKYIVEKKPLPECIVNADFFLYQNYSNPDEYYRIENILSLLKPDCIKLCFPTLHSCNLIFGYGTEAPENFKTISNELPFGKFFYGISNVVELKNFYKKTDMDQTEIIRLIFEQTQKDDFISNEQIIFYYNRSFQFLQNKILKSDIPDLYNFIEKNFMKFRLWHNPNHPTGILLNELVKLIFLKMQLYYDPFDNKNIKVLENSLKDWEMPIFPCVKKYYNINFEDTCSSWYHKDIKDTKTYLEKYISDIYFN